MLVSHEFAEECTTRRDRLRFMQQHASTAAAPTFERLLVSLAARPDASEAGRSDDGLEDDVAVFSYEGSLREHRHCRADDSPADSRTAIEPKEDSHSEPKPSAVSHVPGKRLPLAFDPGRITIVEAEPPQPKPATRNLKSTSVTVRLSESECAQLRARAAETGLTVSAYLRSCTFEVESLRAQVKDALAQMRPAPAKADPSPSLPPRKPPARWIPRMWTREQDTREAARA
jgi:hypothetical protein